MTSDDIAQLLNEALERDRAAIHSLIINRVPTNSSMIEHPTIMVDPMPSEDFPTLGLLGILNGLAGLEGKIIEMVWEKRENGPNMLVRFRAVTLEDHKSNNNLELFVT